MHLLLITALLGCPKTPSASPAASIPLGESPPAQSPPKAPTETMNWTHTLGSDHLLIGRVWRASDGQFVTQETLLADLTKADHVLLGEKHDNADHHQLQAQLITRLAPPAVAFEQLNGTGPLSNPPPDTDLATHLNWADSGWPAFALYAPVFEAALHGDSTLISAHPSPEQVMGAMREGTDSLGAEVLADLPLDQTYSDAQHADLSQEVVDAHCGHANDGLVGMMIEAQRLKDTWMARALSQAGPGSVLVAGNGHTRRDRGVPMYLDGQVRVVSFREVIDGQLDPSDYDEPADYVWFTPRVDDEDPCEKFRDQLEAMGH